MSYTIYASFLDPVDGKKAAGALLDHGVLKDDLSLVVSEFYLQNNPRYWDSEGEVSIDGSPKTGITTTTVGDAGVGAAKGAGIGLALGILGALAALTIPGFGLVIGGGALATAIGSAAATTAAGAVAGGVTGYLKDQGVAEEHAATFEKALTEGGAMIAVQCPSGEVGKDEIETMLSKYGAVNALSFDGQVALHS